jgi:hypothetical protein
VNIPFRGKGCVLPAISAKFPQDWHATANRVVIPPAAAFCAHLPALRMGLSLSSGESQRAFGKMKKAWTPIIQQFSKAQCSKAAKRKFEMKSLKCEMKNLDTHHS